MKDAQREAGEFVLGRLLRVSTALAATANAEQAAQLLANRIGEVWPCDRAVLVSLSPVVVRHCSGGVTPAQRSVLADAIRLAAERDGDARGPCRLESPDRHRPLASAGAADSAMQGPEIVDALQRCLASQGGTSVLWWPLPARDGGPARHALWLERHRGRRWADEDVGLAQRTGALWDALLPIESKPIKARRRTFAAALVATVFAAALIPVPVSVTAPAQVVAASPRHVFSAMDGIVGSLAVQPGQQVRPGDLLLKMDTRVLEKSAEEARQALAVAQAELIRVRAASHYDADARARLPITQIELERARLEFDFQLAQLERAEVRSELAGQVLLENPDRLPGAAVRIGQRLMSIADTSDTRLRIMVPLADFSLVDEAAPVHISLDRTPLTSLAARLTSKGYSVQLSDDQVPSIAVEADWIGGTTGVPLGARGTARIEGNTMPLFQHLLRKPFQALRRIWGL